MSEKKSLVASAKPESTPQGINPPQPSQPRNPEDKQGVVAESTFVPRGPISSVYNRAPAVLDPTTAAKGKWPNKPQSEEPPQRLEPDGKLQVDVPAVKHGPVGAGVTEYHYSLGEVGEGTAPRFDQLEENFFGREENK